LWIGYTVTFNVGKSSGKRLILVLFLFLYCHFESFNKKKGPSNYLLSP